MPRPTRTALLFGLSLVLAGCARAPREPEEAEQTHPPWQPAPTPFVLPGVRTPPVHPARDAALADDEEVIGVVAGGQARAYRIGALKKINRHVVNDLLGKAPVTITYCDQTECIRTFTDPNKAGPLDVDLGGYQNGMLLRFGGTFYRQDTGAALTPGAAPLPFAPLPAERTTWKAWRDAHPDTDIYTGE